MTLADIEKRLGGACGWYTASDVCQAAFVLAMKDRDFSGEMLEDAWAWFAIGWTQYAVYVARGLTRAK